MRRDEPGRLEKLLVVGAVFGHGEWDAVGREDETGAVTQGLGEGSGEPLRPVRRRRPMKPSCVCQSPT